MPASKPLPALPHSSIPSLTVDARQHLRQLITQTINDEGLDARWVNLIESALDVLRLSAERDSWLTGVRKSRKEAARASAAAVKGKGKEVAKERGKETLPTDDGEAPTAASSDLTARRGKDDGEEMQRKAALIQLHRTLSAMSTTSPSAGSSPAPSSRLLLTLAPSADKLAANQSPSLFPYRSSCYFRPGRFSLPHFEADGNEQGEGGVVLFGLEEWIGLSKPSAATGQDGIGRAPSIVGGTFVLKGVPSGAAYDSLARVLRMSVFASLSVLLELSVLRDHHVKLAYVTKSLPPIPATAPKFPTVAEPDPPKRAKTKGGFWSFLAKQTERVLHLIGEPDRHADDIYSDGESDTASLSQILRPETPTKSLPPTPRQSQDSPSPSIARFAAAIERLSDDHTVLSTSPGTLFPPPPLLTRLAREEEKLIGGQNDVFGGRMPIRLAISGDEKAGLRSILGWTGGDSNAQLVGTPGFVRHQAITVLYSEHLRALGPMLDGSSSNGKAATAPVIASLPCIQPHWRTYRYYATSTDKRLGEVVELLCSDSGMCDKAGCNKERVEHSVSWVHAGVRVWGDIAERNEQSEVDSGGITMWTSCTACGEKTESLGMSDASYLLSFGKFLEILIYSPNMSTLSNPICPHTTPLPPMQGEPRLPDSRFILVRHFAFGPRILSFTLSRIDEVFEVRVPRLKIVKTGVDARREGWHRPGPLRDSDDEQEMDRLRMEITHWWKSLRKYMTRVEKYIVAGEPGESDKPLPTTPPSDAEVTPTPSTIKLPPVPLPTPVTAMFSTFDPSSTTRPPPSISELFAALQSAFESYEQELYHQLSNTPFALLNDVRRTFHSNARAALRRLSAWQTKHIPLLNEGDLGEPSLVEPEWWGRASYVMPGSHVIVREDDWGSIISFALSSKEYRIELEKLASSRPGSSSSSSQSSTVAPSPVERSSTPSSTTSSTKASLFRPQFLQTKSNIVEPDPDDDDSFFRWQEFEPYSAEVSRKENPRDLASLLSLRDVLRSQRGTDDPSLTPHASIGPTLARNGARLGTPSTAWARPAVELSLQAADGQVVAKVDERMIEQALQVVEPSIHAVAESSSSVASLTATPNSSVFEGRARRGHASSLISESSDAASETDSVRRDASGYSTVDSTLTAIAMRQEVPILPSKTAEQKAAASNAGSLVSTLSSAMRYVLYSPAPTPGAETPKPGASNHVGLLAMDTPIFYPAIDPKPHIKCDWAVGKRLRISCTIYYANQFESLRRRCGVDDVMLRSLKYSRSWNASGGKSKSNFFKSSDDRFIIKTLVNAWNVADLQVLIELGPAYFRYMDTTSGKPSVLAKLVGFYTIKVKNLESGSTEAKADLLVMENLFYDQKIARSFDLKGIQGRKVKVGEAAGAAKKTLFDSEWIEDQQKGLLLVQPHSKAILQEAIRSDAEFLAKNNIMDYSLLLGIDEDRHELACGLVDTIGSFTFAKTLESKAKQNIQKEVTVIPPSEYQDRFVRAIDQYFLSCPDKWSRPSLSSPDSANPLDLPSVL
ncbi:hypothetical protein BOTBODRAFT_60985 [Botryobasidium botryosum FD-172 SS1]|uniref:PIPK domain-containing protein n=1 Tax=Botryobasidium botryosum (strain FD-172 SS1) TaxID=930990 RepID=A0A067NAU3_BOTB1|nr:hypothetical protein BOTBODRAFT_60985 [Botryobasidium botryosum FD-172 SS1]